jgi:hypothetical protein
MSPLIVSFVPGTSGRFISAISYMLRNNTNENIIWTEDNSAHNFNKYVEYYCDNVPEDLINLYKNQFVNSPLIYQYLKLQPRHIMATHAYPNFELIEEKVPNSKIIIIGYNENNLQEVIFNRIKKNKSKMINPKMVNHKSLHYLISRKDYQFLNIEIPEQYKHNTLVIMYDELYQPYDNSFVALEKLSSFLNKSINESILNNYRLYVDGRNQMLQENNIAKI